MTKYIKSLGLLWVTVCAISVTASAQSTNQTDTTKNRNANVNRVAQPDSVNQLIEIPFGTRSRAELNYAVSALRSTQLTQVPISNLSGLLAGRLSGFLFRWTGNQPGGGNVSYQIRGRSSYAQGSTPTFLVDGIERDFEDMDITEIESVTVLKDAAALVTEVLA